ncbi:esterase-like activity of phytase family protein [Qipengyuania vesicularis]|uniref:esterase-like activity of phytase family protein n=1 Tax=Qipengyuania vesicularis TaxID=2867232 RepID=UPI001C8897A3|nr:esterase-like activity of phytase family protein [Qipengyuania vesicularis]MBX7528178.1 esterase-like activity of phytase family protein [Qipengyuania vesicularis]
MKRLLLLALVAGGLAPGTFVRSHVPPKDYTAPVEVIDLAPKRLRAGPLVLEGAWELASGNANFGGYSALVARSPTRFLAASDAGRLLHFERPDISGEAPRIETFLASRMVDKMSVDVESLTIDPATGEMWAGLEWGQEIMALGAKLERRKAVKPDAMKDWAGNAGPESLVRLADGRFVVIEEYSGGDGRHEGLLFLSDPTSGAKPISFQLQAPEGFRPSDAALLPDGRIAVLLRGFELGFPPRFPSVIAIADPAKIAGGKVLHANLLAPIDEPLPSDNFEGLAVTEEEDGSWLFWLISDDNFATHQRTLLLKLRWANPPWSARQKARR